MVWAARNFGASARTVVFSFTHAVGALLLLVVVVVVREPRGWFYYLGLIHMGRDVCFFIFLFCCCSCRQVVTWVFLGAEFD